MEPAFHRGDLLFLTNRIEDPIRVGEIVVFRIEGREIPIVHRVLKIHEKYVKALGALLLLFPCLVFFMGKQVGGCQSWKSRCCRK